MRALGWILVVTCALAGPAGADEPLLVAAFPLSGDADVAEYLPGLNQSLRAQIRKSSAHLLLTQEKLGENMLMAPAENLAFCAGEAGCIADMGGEAGVALILYGDVKWSFDHSKLLFHLVLVDVAQRAQAAEKFDQVAPGQATDRIAGLVREILGIPEPIPPPPKPAPPAVATATPAPEKPTKPEEPALGDSPGRPTAARPVSNSVTGHAPPPAPAFWENPWTWTAAGVGLASLAAATGLGVRSQQRQDDAARLAATGHHPTAKKRLTEAEDFALGANVLFGLGGAGLATAVVLVVLDLTAEPDAIQPGLACNRMGCGASLSLRF